MHASLWQEKSDGSHSSSDPLPSRSNFPQGLGMGQNKTPAITGHLQLPHSSLMLYFSLYLFKIISLATSFKLTLICFWFGSSLYLRCLSLILKWDPLQISGVLSLCHFLFGVCPVSLRCFGLPKLSFPGTQLRESARLYLPTSCYALEILKVINAGALVEFSYFVSYLSGIAVFSYLMFYFLNSKCLFHIFVHSLVLISGGRGNLICYSISVRSQMPKCIFPDHLPKHLAERQH